MLKLLHPITSINGFKIGDKVRLKDGDGRPHIIKSFSIDGMKEFFFEVQFEDGTETMLDNIAPLTPNASLPSNLDEVAEEYANDEMMSGLAERAFKAGAEWMAGQGWSLDGEIKDQPTGGDDFEIYLDYNRDKMENILDEICDYVNANYPDDDNRYKVIVQIRKK